MATDDTTDLHATAREALAPHFADSPFYGSRIGELDAVAAALVKRAAKGARRTGRPVAAVLDALVAARVAEYAAEAARTAERWRNAPPTGRRLPPALVAALALAGGVRGR
jgi:hypothetical protein